MVVILQQRTNKQKLHKVSHFQCCTQSNIFFVEYSIGYAIGKGRIVMRSEESLHRFCLY
jgi:hypothetical protein